MPGVDYRAVRSLVSISDVLMLLEFAPSESSGDQCRGRVPFMILVLLLIAPFR